MDRVSELGDVQDIAYGGCYYIALTSTFIVSSSHIPETKVLLAGSPEDGGDSNTNIFRELIFGSRISRMSCGWHHAMFIDTNGVVYFLGDNYSMFLCEDETESSVPKVMNVGFTPFDVVCGSYCTFLLE
jgi:alpha-tubulin suppressor-like RCC1 family protein